MAQPQSQLIIKHNDGFGGNFIDSVHLAASYETGKPHMFKDQLNRVFSSKSRFIQGKLVNYLLTSKAGGVKTIDAEVYRWRMQGAEEKSATILENLEASNSVIGLGGTEFRVKVDLDYYSYPDVLFCEDNQYPLQVMNTLADGTGTILTLRIQGDDPSVFLPASYLQVGKQLNKVWTSVPSELNKWYGTQQYPASFMLESQIGAFAQKYTVTDKAWRDQGKLEIEFGYTDRMGKTKMAKRFLPVAESKMWDELYQSMEAQNVYGVKETVPGKHGYWQKTGPGIRPQLKDSWLMYTNAPVTVNQMKDFLMDIFVSRKNETERDVVGITGTIGSMNFHDALAAIANGFLTVDTHYIGTVPSSTMTPNLAYGAQYTQYRGPEGLNIKIAKTPMYDDTTYSRRMHPQYTNLPVDSARITFADFGSDRDGMNNIMKLEVKDTFVWGYHAGTYTPSGPVKGGAVNSLQQGYDVFCSGTSGICIKDPSRCGEIIYDYDY